MLRKNRKKKLLILAVICAFLLFFIVAFMIVASVSEQYIKTVVFQKKYSVTQSDVGNLKDLPPFITEEMLQALFEVQETYGIPVSSGLAQIMQESGWGLYGPNGTSGQGLSGLAYNYKNLFGIKYWSGDKNASGVKNFVTGEQTSTGGSYSTVAGFSIYPSYKACINQRAVMLSKEPYYSRTLALYKNNCDGNYTVGQANAFVYGIRAAGWATDITYVESLVNHMQTYNLYTYDNLTWESWKQSQNEPIGGNVVIGNGYLCNPCPVAYISSEFGPRNSPGGIGSTNHKGRDYAAPSGTPIYASKSGTVERAEYNSVRGYYLLIDHGNGVKTVYQHCSTLQVSVGQRVSKGQQIALVGSTGASTGPHLHFEVWINNVPSDPRNYL